LAKSLSVFRALGLLGPEEVSQLSLSSLEKISPLKKVVGQEFIVSEESSSKLQNVSKKQLRDSGGSRVLQFSEHLNAGDEGVQSNDENHGSTDQSSPHFMSADILLWQRSVSKSTEEKLHKQEALKEYGQSGHHFSVKKNLEDGKEKITIASTQGILIDKKQA
jgi:hypothetical protein